MAKAKMMNESEFAKLIKEFNAVGELIRARQEEKQSVIDAFELEISRYKAGKISKKTLDSSIKKTNKEFMRLDREIRKGISRVNSLGTRANQLASRQAPIAFRAKSGGVGMLSKKKTVKKKVVRKKVAKKKQVKRKPVKKTVKKKK